MPLQFRQARREDIPAICVIRMAVRENVLSDPSRVTPQMCEEYIESLGRGWVCERDGELVGFSIASSGDRSIWALFIHPDHEGLGIGKRLLALAVHWLFEEQRANSVKLSTQADSRADRFYQLQGWARGDMKNEVEVCFTLERSTYTKAFSINTLSGISG